METTYVFIGQNAYTGKSNPTTGLKSIAGTIYQCRSRVDADAYAEHRDTMDQGQIISVGGRRKMREFCLGETVSCFDHNLVAAPSAVRDSDDDDRWIVVD